MRSPRFGEPARVAFVGDEGVDGVGALHAPVHGLQPRFFDFRPAAGHDAGELEAALEAWAPHVVIRFADEDVPLAVDDRLYAPVRQATRPPRALFVGESTEHRERFLIGAKHEYDLLHYAHGLSGDELSDVLARTAVGVNLRDDLRPGFEHTALVHPAAGQLLIPEPLTPTYGLEPGTDFVEVTRPDELMSALYLLDRRPDSYDRVRLAGREKGEALPAPLLLPRPIGGPLHLPLPAPPPPQENRALPPPPPPPGARP